jgi:hypothetical protein
LTRPKMTPSSTGTSCFVLLAYSGECGAPHTNPHKKTRSMASGGVRSQLPFEHKMPSCWG